MNGWPRNTVKAFSAPVDGASGFDQDIGRHGSPSGLVTSVRLDYMVESTKRQDNRVGAPPATAHGLIAGAVLLLCGFVITQLYVWIRFWNLRFSWGEAIKWSVPDIVIWLATVPLIVWLARKLPLARDNLVSRVPIHLVLSIAVSTGVMALLFYSDGWLNWSGWLGAPRDLLSAPRYRYGVSFHTGVMIYWAVVSITQATEFYGLFRQRDAAALRFQADLTRARLQALKMQLDPHFLFNTLNSISVLMRRDPDGADRMLTHLSSLLRMTFESRASMKVSLAQEVDFLRQYLAIQQVRFEDRLLVEFDVPEGVLELSVPNLILQPLVENAIKHGIGKTTGPGKIVITGRTVGSELELIVADDGPGLNGSTGEGTGIGLENTRARLEMFYPEASEFSVTDAEGGGVVARILIPAEMAEEEGGVE